MYYGHRRKLILPPAVDTRICFMMTATNKLIIVLFYTPVLSTGDGDGVLRLLAVHVTFFSHLYMEYTVEIFVRNESGDLEKQAAYPTRACAI